MGKRESFLLILIASFLTLLMYTSGLSLKKTATRESVTISRELLKTFTRDVTVILAGDVMLGRSVMTKTFLVGDFRYPFLKVADKLKEADIVFVNLESPFVENCPSTNSGFKFCASPKLAEGLTFAGIDVVSLANNHALNYGHDGLAQTKKLLAERGIGWVGFGGLVMREVKGVKFGFLGFDLTNKALVDSDLKLIADSDKLCDVLIVGVHWGQEYQASPTNNQKLITKNLVRAGADVIVGHHPHWVQPFDYAQGEDGKRKVIFYSLGNFVFDQMWSEETRKGLVVKLTFKEGELVKTEELPIYMSSIGQPEFVREME